MGVFSPPVVLASAVITIIFKLNKTAVPSEELPLSGSRLCNVKRAARHFPKKVHSKKSIQISTVDTEQKYSVQWGPMQVQQSNCKLRLKSHSQENGLSHQYYLNIQ